MADWYFHITWVCTSSWWSVPSLCLIIKAQESKDPSLFLWDWGPSGVLGAGVGGGIPINRWKMNLIERLFKDKLLQRAHQAGTWVPGFGLSGMRRNAGAPAASYLAPREQRPPHCPLYTCHMVPQLNGFFSNLAVSHAKYFESDTH